jgi:hypothetical protein
LCAGSIFGLRAKHSRKSWLEKSAVTSCFRSGLWSLVKSIEETFHCEIEDGTAAEKPNFTEGQSNRMATFLDQQIEQLENIVERCLNLCKVTWNGVRCTLPANHEETEPHRFQTQYL